MTKSEGRGEWELILTKGKKATSNNSTKIQRTLDEVISLDSVGFGPIKYAQDID